MVQAIASFCTRGEAWSTLGLTYYDGVKTAADGTFAWGPHHEVQCTRPLWPQIFLWDGHFENVKMTALISDPLSMGGWFPVGGSQFLFFSSMPDVGTFNHSVVMERGFWWASCLTSG